MIPSDRRERTQLYIHARYQNPAWQLLASRRAPLVLSCLQSLFEGALDGIAVDDALQALAEMLAEHALHPDFDVSGDDVAALARKELREWIKRGLIVEREGQIFATDALEEAIRFADGFGRRRFMTSTASRLAVVQREIDDLDARLNPDPQRRAQSLQARISALQRELEAVSNGELEVLDEAAAVERIREIYLLATALRADFRRVEDSWRAADQALRRSIVSEGQHRGEIVDALLDGHDQLLETPEGRVFAGFQQQLRQQGELEQMKQQLRTILKSAASWKALDLHQQSELRWLVMRLVKESASVIRARARSERDVRSFLKSGLVAEHHRVGDLLNELFQVAQQVDWQRAAIRRQPVALPPLAFAVAGIPAIERLRFKAADDQARRELALERQATDIDQLDDEFWAAFDGLDREALVQQTLALLSREQRPVTLATLVAALPPTHDLETLTLWLGMAREAGIEIDPLQREALELTARDGTQLRFDVPVVSMQAGQFADFSWEP